MGSQLQAGRIILISMLQERSIVERLDADSFPHRVTSLQRCETPISWVLLTGPYAYKIKKPVRLPFIDASTLTRRQFLCHEELRLNRRFAHDLYLDVVAISERQGRLYVGTNGEPVEYAVRMHQFEASQELAQQLTTDRVAPAEMALFGQRLSHWHQESAAATPTDPYATPELIEAQVRENVETLRQRLLRHDTARLARIEQWTGSELARLTPLFQRRRCSGRVRECHGDLHAGNIVHWHGEWIPFDCLEFEPRLRWIDVISDAAFLFMDLLVRSRPELAYVFLSNYFEAGGDYEGLRLLPFYGVYRALVRAKVAALSTTPVPVTAAPSITEGLTRQLRLAEQLVSARTPALVLMHGVTASGKSFVSTRLIGALGAVRVRSDLERRRLLGTGSYSTSATEATYEQLYQCAKSALEGAQSIIVDATFLHRDRRATFEQLARRYRCPLLIVSCSAPRATLMTRLSGRVRAAADPSEATLEVLEQQLADQQPFEDSERPYVIGVDTCSASGIEQAIDAIRRCLY